MAPSLGGVETLVLHPAATSHRQLNAAGLRAAGIGEGSIRVSVGLEHPEDLWADFEQALAAASQDDRAGQPDGIPPGTEREAGS